MHSLRAQFRQLLSGQIFDPSRDLSEKTVADLVPVHGEPGSPHDFA
jgi:hypothetical protein